MAGKTSASAKKPTRGKSGGVIACEVCLTEIPVSVAKSVEGTDYVHHFCGLDCLQQWETQNSAAARLKTGKQAKPTR